MTQHPTRMAVLLTEVLALDEAVMKTKVIIRPRSRKGPQLLANGCFSPAADDLEQGHKQAVSPCEDLRVQIARRAYQLQVARGCQRGDLLDEWLQAEQETLGQSNAEC